MAEGVASFPRDEAGRQWWAQAAVPDGELEVPQASGSLGWEKLLQNLGLVLQLSETSPLGRIMGRRCYWGDCSAQDPHSNELIPASNLCFPQAASPSSLPGCSLRVLRLLVTPAALTVVPSCQEKEISLWVPQSPV